MFLSGSHSHREIKGEAGGLDIIKLAVSTRDGPCLYSLRPRVMEKKSTPTQTLSPFRR